MVSSESILWSFKLPNPLVVAQLFGCFNSLVCLTLWLLDSLVAQLSGCSTLWLLNSLVVMPAADRNLVMPQLNTLVRLHERYETCYFDLCYTLVILLATLSSNIHGALEGENGTKQDI